MNPRVKALIKALFVGGMIYYVTTLITFDDLLVVREGQEVVESQQIEIQGDWRADPVSFLLDGELQVERASRTLQDGRSVDVQPGFLSYLSNLDPSWFALGILCYLATVMIAGGRWWWLLASVIGACTVSRQIRWLLGRRLRDPDGISDVQYSRDGSSSPT